MKFDFNDNWLYEGKLIRLPHDAMITEDRDSQAPDRGEESYFTGRKYEYRKLFNVPSNWRTKKICIEFEGVCQEATLSVNGTEVFSWPFAYTDYVVDITAYLRFGEENLITVTADRSIPETTRWYSGGGITRPVFLHIEENTPVESGSLHEISNRITGSPVPPRCRKVTVSHKEGLLIDGVPVKLRGAAIHHDNGILGAVSLKDAELRRVRKLSELGYNAVRTAHNPPSRYFLEACDELNIYVILELFDVWDQPKMRNDYSRFFEKWWRSDLERTVALAKDHPCVIMYSIANEIRDTCRPRVPELAEEIAETLKAADPDRLTVNCVNGMFSVLSKMGVILEDILPEDEKKPVELGEILAAFDEHISEVMTHRVVTEDTEPFFSPVDVAGYNYMDSRYDMDGKLFPERVICGTETFPQMIGRNWPLVEKYPYVIGDFCWTGIDFLGECGLGKMDYELSHTLTGPYPWISSNTGDLDLIGNRRPQSFYRDLIWGNTEGPLLFVERPELYGKPCCPNYWSWPEVLSGWTWPGSEGRPVRVEVYSKAEEVGLFLNGREIGRKRVPGWEEARKTGNRMIPYVVSFSLTYEPGTLTACEYTNGEKGRETALHTNGKPEKIVLLPERHEAPADGDSLIYIGVEIRDNADNLSFINTPVTIAVRSRESSPVTLLAFGNGDPRNTEKYTSFTHKTYNGKALLVLRTTKIPGEIEVTAASDGLDSASIHLAIL